MLTKKSYFQNFSWFQFHVQKVMHDYVRWHCSIYLLCWFNSPQRKFMWKLLLFHIEMISAFSFGEMYFVKERYK